MPQNPIVEIERMGYGAEAVGRLASGKAVFVRGAAPGDVVSLRMTEEKASFARAVVDEVVEPSSSRASGWEDRASDLALQATAPWSHLSYAAQLAAKQGNVASALARTAHMDAGEVDRVMRPIVPSGDEWGYRNKLELAAASDSQGRLLLGFHESASGKVAPARECRLGNRLLLKAPRALAGALRYLAGGGDLGIYRAGVRASTDTRSVEVALWTPPSSFPRGFAAKMLRDAVGATSVVRVIAEPGKSRKVKRVEVLDGDGCWRERMGDVRFGVSAPSFFQVNTAQAARLVEIVMDAVAPKPGEIVADLYSGVGTFAIPLSRSGADVVAIELEGSSSRDFRKNAEANGVEVDMTCDDVARALPSLGALDAVVVDPPRAGLRKEVAGQIAEAGPSRVAYVSCDPQTLARDIARLRPFGYVPKSVAPVDLFPQTYHVETVCVLARG